MAKYAHLHARSFEKNIMVDTVSSKSAGMSLKNEGLSPETSAIPGGSCNDKENGQNIDSPGKSGGSRNKSRKSRGSENSKKRAGKADAKTAKDKSAVSGGSGTRATPSMSKEASNDVDGSTVNEATEHVERMTDAEGCGRDIPVPTQDDGSSYPRTGATVENGMDDNTRDIDGNENNRNRVSQAFVWFKQGSEWIKNRVSQSSVWFHQASEWIQQQKSVLIALSAGALQAKDFAISRVQHTWPMVSLWLLHFGKLSLLFLILWLDCSLRGLGSVLQLGTTSFFVIIWCSFLSIFGMAGFFKVMFSLGAVCTVSFFLGYTSAFLATAFLGAVVLWMHGSFWTTVLLITVAGIIFALNREHLALLITMLYSIYCAKCHVGWIGIIVCMNLAFISSDILIYFLKINASENKGKSFDEQAWASKGGAKSFSSGSGYRGPSSEQGNYSSSRSFGESSQSSQSVDSGLNGGDPTSAEEVIRLMDSPDHYAVLGFSRYENIDIAVLKREYRKKAMLVHPDKNMGNVKAEEAFKKLQNAYEVLLDSVKRKIYDEELRKEELMNCFRRFQSGAPRNGSYGPFKHGYANSEDKGEDCAVDSRRISCKKCNDSHVWIQTDRTKARARWCQECQDYHQAKDGDGWIEQSGQSFLFGMLRKVDVPRAYACVESRIYDASEWFICQGMKCPPNTHKPTFHVNTTIAGKNNARGGSSTYKAGTTGGIPTNLDENMTEEEFFEWLQNAMASGMFESGNGMPENAGMKTGSHPKNNKKKRRGKKQW
uniref:J domain-containing protein n=2 Tax=Araucaria cunninghamii TaxID=56994 RepID=A0A0D6R025_ARACU